MRKRASSYVPWEKASRTPRGRTSSGSRQDTSGLILLQSPCMQQPWLPEARGLAALEQAGAKARDSAYLSSRASG